jgi:hypothetical protein
MCPSRSCMFPLLVAATSYCAQQRPVGNHISPPYTPAESGKKMFNAYCASCHGVKGTGNGPAAALLKTRPTDLTQLAKRNSGVFPSAWVARVIKKGTTPAHGSSEMPVLEPGLNRVSGHDEGGMLLRIHNLVSHIGTMQRN